MAQGSAQQRLPEGSDLYQVAGQGPRQEVRVEPQCRRPGLPFEVLQQRKGLWTAHGLSQTGIGISLSCLLACLLACKAFGQRAAAPNPARSATPSGPRLV